MAPPLERETADVLKYALLFTALLGLLAHAFAFFNLKPSHDSLFYFYTGNDSLREHISFGRPLYFFYHILTGSRLVMPWAVGALSLFWIGLAVFLTARLFELRGKPELCLLAGIFVTNRTITALTGTYIHDLGTYAFSLLLGSGAVMCWRRSASSRGCRLLFGAGLTALSLGLYQGFLSTIITLIMLRSMLDLLQGQDGRQVLRRGLWGMGMILAGFLGYLLILRSFCVIFDVELALLLLLAAALPLGANLIRVVAPETHDLMYFAFWLFYLYPVLVFREVCREGIKLSRARVTAGVLTLCSLFLLYSNIQTANLVYLKKEIQYHATMSLINNVMYDVERLDGYVEGVTQVSFVGTPSDVLYASPGTDQVNGITAMFYSSPITYNYERYFTHLLQRRTLASRGYGMEEWPEVQQMPRYPQPGYAAMINGIAVVRFQ